jgi:hypothetical protein
VLAAEPARWRPHLCATSSAGLQQPRKPLQLAAVGATGAASPRPLPQDTALRFEALMPGMLVEAHVAGVLADGVRRTVAAPPTARHALLRARLRG